ncbi:unnamed protein product, partial [Ixodes hexagonus]
PLLGCSRIPFLVSKLQTFFAAESTFHAENSTVFAFLVEAMQKLALEGGHPSSGSSFHRSPHGLSNELQQPRSHLAVYSNSEAAQPLGSHRWAPLSRHVDHSERPEPTEPKNAAAVHLRRSQSDRRRSRSNERLAMEANASAALHAEMTTTDASSLHKSRLLSRYSEQQLCGGVRDGTSYSASAKGLPGHRTVGYRSSSIQHLPASARTEHEDAVFRSGGCGDVAMASPRKGPSGSALFHHGDGKRGLEEDSPDRVTVEKAQYAKVRRYSEQTAERCGGFACPTAARPSSSYRYSVERLHDGFSPGTRGRHGGSFMSLDAGYDVRGSVNRPVELYLVVRPPAKGVQGAPGGSSEAAVQTGSRVGTDEVATQHSLGTGSVSREADTRPYEEIEFKKGKSNRASDISIKVTETNGQLSTPPLMASPVRSDPQCIACGTSSRMKCIWLNDAEFSFLRYQPWQCLRCAVNCSFETASAGQRTADVARRNLCIWFTRVTRLKANYTELQCKVLPSTAQAARLEQEEASFVNTPGYRGSYTGDHNGQAPTARKREEKDYEPVDVGAQMNKEQHADRNLEELYDIPVGATTTDLPAGVLYRVRATYKYTAEDVDELNFESGEIIRVIEYDDPEEQEEGWLMGIKESSGEKGLFPANFTRPI